jgi:hypothetical protein
VLVKRSWCELFETAQQGLSLVEYFQLQMLMFPTISRIHSTLHCLIWYLIQPLQRQTVSYLKEHCSWPYPWGVAEWCWCFPTAFFRDLVPSAWGYLFVSYCPWACSRSFRGVVSHKYWGFWRNLSWGSICTRQRGCCLCLSSSCRSAAHSQYHTPRRRRKGLLQGSWASLGWGSVLIQFRWSARKCTFTHDTPAWSVCLFLVLCDGKQEDVKAVP